jgi:hypothetical protein
VNHVSPVHILKKIKIQSSVLLMWFSGATDAGTQQNLSVSQLQPAKLEL